MARYYYTDALKAALMSEEFRFKFTGEKGQDLIHLHNAEFALNDEKLDENGDMSCTSYLGDKYYIHPDCHEMLMPQVGDLTKVYDKLYKSGYHTVILTEKTRQALEQYTASDWEIIQRNGKAWFTPEVEGD